MRKGTSTARQNLAPTIAAARFELSLNAAGHWDEPFFTVFPVTKVCIPSLRWSATAAAIFTVQHGEVALMVKALCSSCPPRQVAADFQVLHSFDGTDGVALQSSVAIDASGNLYGTALCSGSPQRLGRGS